MFGCILGFSQWTFAGVAVTTEQAYQLNDRNTSSGSNSSIEITQIPLDTSSDPPGPPDSHEAMNNRELKLKLRQKRSFEFLVGLINNNSKYEVVRADPGMPSDKRIVQASENQTEATNLLLELLMKIVKYPDRWRRIHQVLKTLDEDLINTQHILRYHQLQEQQNSNSNSDSKRGITVEQDSMDSRYLDRIEETRNKWPTFDEYEDSTKSSMDDNYAQKQKAKSNEKQSYQKNFAYHKVTGKPAHLGKNPIAYVAVSAISPQPSTSEEDFMLETELHQLKPWKNKNAPTV